MSLPPYQGSQSSSFRQNSDLSHPASDMEELKRDVHGFAATDSSIPSYHHRPEHLQTLQPLQPSQMSLLSGSNATTPRQSAFSREQVDRPPQPALTIQTTPYPSSSTAVANPVRMSFLDSPESFTSPSTLPAHFDASRSMQIAPGSSYGASHHNTSLHQRSPYSALSATIQVEYTRPEVGVGLSSNHFGYDSPSSSNNSPNRTHGYYDLNSVRGGYGAMPSYPFYGASGKAAITDPNGGMSHADMSSNEIDALLGQIASLYKAANTKKNAEFYRDKWCRVWLSCNYSLKPSLQISIPRTILHESYRITCETYGLQPLQAASFGKILRGQFPDVAQRRLGGRGKTRFHYCGFGTANEREALKVKQLLDFEKAGKLLRNVGTSAESVQGQKAPSMVGSETETGSTRALSTDGSQLDHNENRLGLGAAAAGPSSSIDSALTTDSRHSSDDRLAASAFATLNSAVAASHSPSTAPTTSNSIQASQMPRRHTVSVSFPQTNHRNSVSSQGFHFQNTLGNSGGFPNAISLPMQLSSLGSGGQTEEASVFQSQANSPDSLLQGHHLSRPQSLMQPVRCCKDLPDWPAIDETDSTLSAASTNLSPNGKHAWREYENMCQDLLNDIYRGPDLETFERRITFFWSTLSQTSQEALRSEPTLADMILRGDAIISHQLLARLDDLIGDDLADDKIASLQSTALHLASSTQSLLESRFPFTFVRSKVQASEKVAEGLDRIAKIFDSIRRFRDVAMLDEAGDATGRWVLGGAGSSFMAPLSSESQTMSSSGMHIGDSVSSVGHPQAAGIHTNMQKPAFPFVSSQLAHFQGRKRDDSIGSSVSDSHYTWMSGDQAYSLSASESEFSVNSGSSNPTDLGANSGISTVQLPVARKWSNAHRMRMSSGPLTRPNLTSEGSGSAISNSLSGMALGSHRSSPSESPRQTQTESGQTFGSTLSPHSRNLSGSIKTEPPSLHMFIQHQHQQQRQHQSQQQQQQHQHQQQQANPSEK